MQPRANSDQINTNVGQRNRANVTTVHQPNKKTVKIAEGEDDDDEEDDPLAELAKEHRRN